MFVINLDKSKKRMNYINKQLKREHINYTRFSAINGKELDIKYIKKR